MRRIILVVLLGSLLGGCVAYTAVAPGQSSFGSLQVTTSQAWNQAPAAATPAARKGSKVWTQDGLLLDRLIFIPAVPSGEAIFRVKSKDQALPVFKADMLPNEIEELTESSIVKLFGEGQVSVETKNLRPHKFGASAGFLFDMQVAVSDGPDYGGITGAFVSGDQLYLVLYLGAQPYYFDKHRDEALAIIRGASI
jgi:hypothetical protein